MSTGIWIKLADEAEGFVTVELDQFVTISKEWFLGLLADAGRTWEEEQF